MFKLHMCDWIEKMCIVHSSDFAHLETYIYVRRWTFKDGEEILYVTVIQSLQVLGLANLSFLRNFASHQIWETGCTYKLYMIFFNSAI